MSKIQQVLDEFGELPLEGTQLGAKPLRAAPETILAMTIDAMIKSRPISHELSQKTVETLIGAGLHDVRKLAGTSWDDETMILKDGGYNRYREQGATNLLELARFVEQEYDGDLNNLYKSANFSREKVGDSMKHIKGLGDLGVDIFLNNVQSVWPDIAPFLDARSQAAADEIGIGTDLDAIYADVQNDPRAMSRFANGLSKVRLERKITQFKDG